MNYMLKEVIEIDKNLMIWINNSLSNQVFDLLMPIVTNENLWVFPILILIGYLGYFSGKRGKIAIGILLITTISCDAICAQILKPWIGRIRPSHEIVDQINLLASKGGKWSFPSNHAANSFAAATVLSYFYERFKIVSYSLAFLIALSRIYVGVHYPGDILAGGIVGYSLAWIMLTLWVIIKMRELKQGRFWVWYDTTGTPKV
tara:strand:+ start:329 stop:937 length:609 start_codon:yes stop_codon:yes gene_type:complete